ncbi:MAG: VCBS repeat-containing protein [Syntrophales bacterium LBB04]|nr:VCBS repeat-containing protein [Syntrophales bacterium LBB04]
MNQSLSSTCTIAPNNGYRLATLTDNGSDVKGQIAANVYTIPNVTTNHMVVASFLPGGATIFWRNISTGENTVWYMDGSTHTGTALVEPLTGPWRMVATADFNNDGEADILWRNFATGANMVWYMNGGTHKGSADLPSLTDLNWRIVGTGDFNSDGKPDLVWRNSSTGANMVWYMNGITHTGSADLALVPDQNWNITGTTDFDGDGKRDIVWRNSATGQNVVWYMEGITHTSIAFLDTVTDQNWKMIVGTADLNNDGKLDILWRNTATGANMVWSMNGATHTGTAGLDAVTDQNWEMAGQSNY